MDSLPIYYIFGIQVLLLATDTECTLYQRLTSYNNQQQQQQQQQPTPYHHQPTHYQQQQHQQQQQPYHHPYHHQQQQQQLTSSLSSYGSGAFPNQQLPQYAHPYAPRLYQPSPFIDSFASAVPGSSMNSIVQQGPLDTVMPSHQPPPGARGRHQQTSGTFHQVPHNQEPTQTKPAAPPSEAQPQGEASEQAPPADQPPPSSSSSSHSSSSLSSLPSSSSSVGFSALSSLLHHMPPYGTTNGGAVPSYGTTNVGGAPSVRLGHSGVKPLTKQMKAMVNRWAAQFGFQAYYEAHGCVDPTTVLRGTRSQRASFAMMVGCHTREAQDACQMAQVAQSGGGRVSQARMMMEIMMPPQTKKMFEHCLAPSTMMSGMTGFLSSMTSQNNDNKLKLFGVAPPRGASLANQQQAPYNPDCSIVSQMLMMNPSASSEGLFSPESMEQIGILRNKYLTMTCQENLIMGRMPYRMCCPGKVRPPSIQEAMMMNHGMMGGGAK